MQKLVLIVLADRHNTDLDRCDPSMERVARDCGMSREAVRAAMRALEAKKLVTVKRRKQGTMNLPNVYALHLEETIPQQESEPFPATRGTPLPPSGGPSPTKRGSPPPPHGGTPTAKRGTLPHEAVDPPPPGGTEPVIEPVIEPKSTSAPSSSELDAAGGPAMLGTLPCTGEKKNWAFTEADVGSWRQSYPGVDVLQQLRSMREWLQANSTRRKTYRGMRAFCVNWLNKEQNRAGGANGNHAGRAQYGSRTAGNLDAAQQYIRSLEGDRGDAGDTG